MRHPNLPPESMEWANQINLESEGLQGSLESLRGREQTASRSVAGKLAALGESSVELGFRRTDTVVLSRFSQAATSSSPTWGSEQRAFQRPDAGSDFSLRPRAALLTCSVRLSASNTSNPYNAFTSFEEPSAERSILYRQTSFLGLAASAPSDWVNSDIVQFSVPIIFEGGETVKTFRVRYACQSLSGSATIRWDDCTFSVTYGGLS